MEIIDESFSSMELIKKKMIGIELNQSEIKEIIQDINDGKLNDVEIAGFVFSQQMKGLTIKEIVGMINAFVETGNKINWGKQIIYGKHSTDEREVTYKETDTTNNKVIIATYGVASTGINIPRVFNLFLIEVGKSFVRVIQSIGRALRTTEDKDFAKVYDICSDSKYSKRHLTERKKFYKERGYPFKVRKIKYK